MLLSSSDASPWSQAIWGRCEGRVCDCAQRVMSAVSPLLLSDQSLEDVKMSRNPLALLHMLMLERGLAPTPQLCLGWVDQVPHPFYVTTSVLCFRPTYTALLADFGLPAATFPRQAPAWYHGCGCLALADNPEHGHLLWHTMAKGCGHLSLPRTPNLWKDRCYLLLLCPPNLPGITITVWC